MQKWFKTLPREWERPDVELKDFRPFLPAARMPSREEIGKLSLEKGDLLYVPRCGMAQIVEIDYVGSRVRVWPYYGDDVGYFSIWDVTGWRNDTWGKWHDAGIAPVDLARAMFPGNWR